MMVFQGKILQVLYRFIRTGLIPFAPLYLLFFKAIQIIKNPRVADIPVICVGNITTGGTGKTPAVIYIAELLKELGYSPAVVSRGYGGSKTGSGAIVTDGNLIFLTPEEAGDEAYLMAINLRGVPIAVGKNRLDSISLLKQEFNIDIIVMDDGFQNFSIKKDISVVVIDATRPFGNGLLLPAGDLREPRSSLNRGDIIILNKSDLVSDRELISLIKKINVIAPAIKIFNSCYSIDSMCRLNNINYKKKVDSIAGKKVLAVAAIGNPEAFFRMVEKYKPAQLKPVVFPDHYRFNEGDIKRLVRLSKNYDYVIMTEKDHVKLKGFILKDSFFYLKIRMDISDNNIFKNYFI